MARQRTPDAQKRVLQNPPDAVVETGVRAWLLRRRKMLAALVGIPVSIAFVKLGLVQLLGAELGKEVEVGLSTLIVAAIVERVPNKKAAS
jgi:hypothetical protein